MRRIVAALVAVVLSSATFRADDKPPEPHLFAQIKAAGLNDKPFTLIVRLAVKPDQLAAFEALATDVAKASQAEKGCRAYEFHRSAKNKNEYTLFEKWQDAAALQSHMGAEHTKKILAAFGTLGATPPSVELLSPVP